MKGPTASPIIRRLQSDGSKQKPIDLYVNSLMAYLDRVSQFLFG